MLDAGDAAAVDIDRPDDMGEQPALGIDPPAFGLSWTLDPSWSERFGWASEWVGAGTTDGSDSRGLRPSSPKPLRPVAPVRLRCQLCGETFADGELSGNTHHDLPLERM